MNSKQLAEIEARAKAATGGPWTVVGIGDGGFESWFLDMSDKPETMFADGGTVESNKLNPDNQDKANLQFCAEARQDIPDLIAALREAWEEIEIMSRERRQMDESWAELEAQKAKHG